MNGTTYLKKVLLVLRREYLTRLRSRWFLVATFLGPILLVGFMFIPVLVMYWIEQQEETYVLAVVDRTGQLVPELEEALREDFSVLPVQMPEDSLRAMLLRKEIDAYLLLPPDLIENLEATPQLYTLKGGGMGKIERLREALNRLVIRHRLEALGVSEEVLRIARSRVRLRTLRISEEGRETVSAGVYAAAAYVAGFLMYILVLGYGGLVMRGVLEEKTNRIVEVIVSSVRPFQLMMGKVLGIGLLGLTQAVAWLVLILGGMTALGTLGTRFLRPEGLPAATEAPPVDLAQLPLPDIGMGVIVAFIIFFIGGYLIYASLFAAIAAPADQESDVQSLQFPITLLVVVPILVLPLILEQPESTAAVVLSIIPFFSPILMIARMILVDVPLWEVLLAMVLLVACFLGMIALSGRIYRIGILMYGRRPTLRDLIRWARMG